MREQAHNLSRASNRTLREHAHNLSLRAIEHCASRLTMKLTWSRPEVMNW
jgi:hypothetical protein